MWAHMEQFKMDNNNAKFIFWALHARMVVPSICQDRSPNMLEIGGWSPDIKRIVQAFGKDYF